MIPLSWSEIKAWQDLTGTDVEFWEAQLIRNLSVAYVAQYNLARDMNCAPPWYYKPGERVI
jgi:hypothetical protein